MLVCVVSAVCLSGYVNVCVSSPLVVVRLFWGHVAPSFPFDVPECVACLVKYLIVWWGGRSVRLFGIPR